VVIQGEHELSMLREHLIASALVLIVLVALVLAGDGGRSSCEALVSRLPGGAYSELYNMTRGFTWFGCIHWVADVSKTLSSKYNISEVEAFNAVWCLCYLHGKCADNPFMYTVAQPTLLTIAILVLYPVAVVFASFVSYKFFSRRRKRQPQLR